MLLVERNIFIRALASLDNERSNSPDNEGSGCNWIATWGWHLLLDDTHDSLLRSTEHPTLHARYHTTPPVFHIFAVELNKSSHHTQRPTGAFSSRQSYAYFIILRRPTRTDTLLRRHSSAKERPNINTKHTRTHSHVFLLRCRPTMLYNYSATHTYMFPPFPPKKISW